MFRRTDMSTASCLLSEDQFRCFVCQNIFRDPVSTPCGHNFCKICVTDNFCVDVPFQCPMCEKMFYPKPELQVNTLITELLDVYIQSAQRQNPEPVNCNIFRKTLLCGNIQDMIEELKHCSQLSTEDAWTFSSAKRCVNLTSEQNRTYVERLSAAHLELIFIEVMKKEIPKLLIRAELMRAQRYVVDVTLDPDTVHPMLVLSDDRKQVRCCDPKTHLPHDQKRFMHCKYVLGKQSFSSGRFYFEVQVRGKINWTLGVAKESVKRVGLITLSPQSGYWSLTVRNGNEFYGMSEPPVYFSLQRGPEKVGVFVDYEEGLVFFYDVDAAVLMYSFTGCFFTERLHPFFGTGNNYDGTNGAPLIISAFPLLKLKQDVPRFDDPLQALHSE
ncbi:pyrin-like [Girardinichthys multiradiatus]|uniref:pyrin-like n=1 Tax=Girardinichthys multiradiatus TaxID=208333 RepID=UPI001FAC544E|nr:pyrin-like [Girardinichthys multiradiatus]